MKIFTSTVRAGALGLGLVAYVAALPARADEVVVQTQGQSKQATAGGSPGWSWARPPAVPSAPSWA